MNRVIQMDKKIKWAERLPRNLIRRLYESDAKHIQDNELADEVGYGLYTRAKDLIEINHTHDSDMIHCRSCNSEIYKSANDIYKCNCGWNISQKEYHLSYKGKQFISISAAQFAVEFMRKWELAKDSYADKMIAIDYLIHRFHDEFTECTTRPAAINFIEGKSEDIIDLILELAYGNDNEIYKEQMEIWLENAPKSPWLSKSVFEKKELIEKNKN
jgi:hypothetical protein